MKRFALYIGLVAGIVVSCSTKENDFVAPAQEDEVFYASLEKPTEDDTRVYANEDLLLRWTIDDRISIFNKNTYNQQYRFIGETGDYEGGFSKVGDPEFMTGSEIPHVVSVYPFQRQTRVSEKEVITVTLPSEQHYAENTFGLGDNTMVSVSSGNLLYYKNVGGYLMLKLYGEGVSFSSITLKSNNGEKIAGNAYVTMPVNGNPSVEMASDATSEIKLVFETPVQLGANAEESTQFWFVVPPVTFSKGFTISVTKSSGIVFSISTDKSIAIERNTLSKMSPIEVSFDFVPIPDAVDLGLSVKWASFNVGASSPDEYGAYYAWGETEPKDYYSWETYKWGKGSSNALTKYCNNSSYGYCGFTDSKTVLDPEDDAAHVNLGGKWRMPTEAEWRELEDNCTWSWTTMNGKSGYKVTASNGNSIFLPAAGHRFDNYRQSVGSYGYYWPSSLYMDIPYDAWRFLFNSEGIYINKYTRSSGCSVRPVYGANDEISISVEASAELFYDNGDSVHIDPIRYEGFNHKYLSDEDLEEIFIDLTKHAPSDFTSAVLSLSVYDAVSGGLLQNESYGVVYDPRTGHYNFASMNV